MERFGSDGHFASYDPQQHLPQRVSVFLLQCRACGFEPDDVVRPPKICPKCHSEAWERYARPGSILQNADRY
jgi:hypothetical protein